MGVISIRLGFKAIRLETSEIIRGVAVQKNGKKPRHWKITGGNGGGGQERVSDQ